MAVDPADPGKLGEAVAMMIAWATPPGLIALICAWFGYRRRTKDEQRDALPPNPMALVSLYSDRMAIAEAAQAVTRMAAAVEGLTRATDELTREVRLSAEHRRLN